MNVSQRTLEREGRGKGKAESVLSSKRRYLNYLQPCRAHVVDALPWRRRVNVTELEALNKKTQKYRRRHRRHFKWQKY